MSYITNGQNGLAAVESKNWDEAIRLLSLALKQSSNPAWLLGRALAYQETKQYDQALDDAEYAYVRASERQQPSSRSQMIDAQYRRAVVLGHLKRYADADACCVWSQKLIEGGNFRRDADTVAQKVDAEGNYLATAEDALVTTGMPSDSPLGTGGPRNTGSDKNPNKGGAEWSRAFVWRSIMLKAMQKLPEESPGRKITVRRVPEVPASFSTPKQEAAAKTVDKATSTTVSPPPVAAAAQATPTAQTTPTAKWAVKKLRVDFYQTANTVNLVLYAKGADKDKVVVDVLESEVRLSNLPEATLGSTWAILDLDGRVSADTGKTVKVTPFKIELTLNKDPAGVKWASWGSQREEGSGAAPPAAAAVPEATAKSTSSTKSSSSQAQNQPKPPKPSASAPVYPSSSRTGPKNWDKLDIDAAVDEDEGSDPSLFFKQLYSSSTPEQQRAMMKSFTESNGTALSTDWSSVKDGKVPTQPPDGVEAKDW